MMQRVLSSGALGLALASSGPVAHAALFDFLFGATKVNPSEVGATRQAWPVAEFSEVRLVIAEAGAAPNAHPSKLTEATLRQLLGAVRTTVGGDEEPLFAPDELADICAPIQKALAMALPNDDVLLRSASRRGASRFAEPLAVTARLFVSADRLNLIVMDNRNEFFLRYRAEGRLPAFDYGSRAVESRVSLRYQGAPGPRPDWLQIPLSGEPAPMVAPVAAASTPAAAPSSPARGATSAAELEQRLETLKRLRDKGLIDDGEYRQKRREVLQLL